MTSTPVAVRHVLDLDDLSPDELREVLRRSTTPIAHRPLVGRTVGLYFEKPSLRTRHSCEAAIVQLGGHPVTFRRDEVGSGEREPIADIARVLSGYHAALGCPGLRPRPARRAGGRRHDPGRQPPLGPGPSLPGARRPADDEPDGG